MMIFLYFLTLGSKIKNANIYLNPANNSGGISSIERLINTQDNDHNTVTNKACGTARVREERIKGYLVLFWDNQGFSPQPTDYKFRLTDCQLASWRLNGCGILSFFIILRLPYNGYIHYFFNLATRIIIGELNILFFFVFLYVS